MTDATLTMPAAATPATPSQTSGVTITGLDIPFTKLVVFFFKAFFAAIPAIIASFLVIRLMLGAIWMVFGGWRYGYWAW